MFEAASDGLTQLVRRVHIGTHDPDNERRLRTFFGGLSWTSLYDSQQQPETPYGRMLLAGIDQELVGKPEFLEALAGSA